MHTHKIHLLLLHYRRHVVSHRHYATLEKKNIKAILTLSVERKPKKIDGITYYYVPFLDKVKGVNILDEILPRCLGILDEVIKKKKMGVLVHCLRLHG